ncbi:MAG: flippase-like domain-containing protein [Candidatus Latescibacterota bacterium]|nr:MAG: flippase-like domain-containing protein [Candidatus Latescibacterota bacterium]
MPARAQTRAAALERRSAPGGWRLLVVKITISTALLWLILRRFEFQDLKSQILQTDPQALLLPFAIVLASNLLGGLQWSWLVRTAGVLVALGRLIGLYFTGLFFNHFGVGNLGGDVYKIYSLGRSEGAFGRVAGATIVDRVVGAAALCSLALVAACVALARGEMPLPLVLVILVFSGLVTSFAGLVLHGAWGEGIEGWLAGLRWEAVTSRLSRLVGYLREYRERTAVLNTTFVLSLLIQSARVLAHYFVAVAMGWTMHPSDLAKFFLVIPILGLVIALPISIGGWGVREWAGVMLFAPLGRDGEESVTLLALTASLTFVVSLGGGIFFLVAGWPRRSRPEPT